MSAKPNTSMPGCARRVIGRLPTTTGRPAWAARFFVLPPSNTIEDYTRRNEFYHALSDTHYSMIRRDGGVLSAALADRFCGEGNQCRRDEGRLRAWARATMHGPICIVRPRGTLIELPLGWYPDRAGGSGRCRRVPIPIIRGRAASFLTSACSAITEFRRSPRGTKRPAATLSSSASLPEGIDCQRCHGPGGTHVRTVATAGAKVEEIRAQHRESRPPECQTREWRSACSAIWRRPADAFPREIERFNRGPFSYLPGEPLEDFTLFFDHAPGTGHDEQIRGREFRIPAASIQVFCRQRWRADLSDLPQSASGSRAARKQ